MPIMEEDFFGHNNIFGIIKATLADLNKEDELKKATKAAASSSRAYRLSAFSDRIDATRQRTQMPLSRSTRISRTSTANSTANLASAALPNISTLPPLVISTTCCAATWPLIALHSSLPFIR